MSLPDAGAEQKAPELTPEERLGTADAKRTAAFRRELVLEGGCDNRLATELAESYAKRLAGTPSHPTEPQRVAVTLRHTPAAAWAREILAEVAVAMDAGAANPLSEVLQPGSDEAAFARLRVRVGRAYDALCGEVEEMGTRVPLKEGD